MKTTDFQLRGVGDARLAVYAASNQPAWLWSTDGTHVLWANPVASRLFNARNGAELAARVFRPADPHRRQVMQLAGRLPLSGAVRLERLRGFGAALGGLMTCACARLNFSDGSAGVLVVAAEPSGRAMPLVERLQRLVEGIDRPIAAFARDGMFVGASDAAHALLGFRNLSEAGLDGARDDALKQGRVETPIGIGHMVLQRVGSGADIGLIALIEPNPPVAADIEPQQGAADHSAPAGDEVVAMSGEAPAEFTLVDEFADPPAEHRSAEATAEPAAVPEMPAETTPAPQAAHGGSPPVEPAPVETAATTQPPVIHDDEPSPFVEAVADEPSPPATETAPDASPAATTPASGAMPSDEPLQMPQRPLRFLWQMDADGRLSLGTDEFIRLIGARTAAAFGKPWREIAEALALDPDGQFNKAIATRQTWSGVTLNWPVDGGDSLPVELSGLPIYDRDRNFAGYRGFGVCRDLDALTRVASQRRADFPGDPPAQPPQPESPKTESSETQAPQSLSADIPQTPDLAAPPDAGPPDIAEPGVQEASNPTSDPTSHPAEPNISVETPKNVLPFRPVNDARQPSLTPVENNAFNELARQLAARLEAEKHALGHESEPESAGAASLAAAPHIADEAVVQQPAAAEAAAPGSDQPEWLSAPEPPAQGHALRDKALLDLLPVGILIYRLDRLLYANRAFLDRIGYASLQALENADGLDALFVEPVGQGSSTSEAGTAVTIAATPASADHAPLPPTGARLYSIAWDGESAMALICSHTADEPAPAVAAPEPVPSPMAAEEPVASAPLAAGQPITEELAAILDTTAEGVVMFDGEGNLHACNRSAEALFGYDGADLTQRNLAELFVPESQRAVRDYLEGLKGDGVGSLLDQGREVLGRVRGGGVFPLSMTMGRTRPEAPNFFAVFRDLSQIRKNEAELLAARRQAERAASAKADVLARISHEVRTPLNAIIGFAEVMIDERFGALGNERYVEYMKDIRASGERVIAIINDLNDLSRIETGKIDLAFANQNLNELVESCVAVMQPQANRERIIIRTSLAHMLPPVIADARALRQITLNLIGNSIHLANAGGQVIVSTALSDFGEVVLRVRDTGHGMNDNDVAAALEPFRTEGPTDQTADSAAVSLSLTKALVEANRAQFHIKPAPHSGTLIEVLFSHAAARA